MRRIAAQSISGIIFGLTMWVSSCVPDLDPAIDEATVLANNTSVRIDSTTSARTLFTLGEGERVSIIEKNGTWYRIRDADLLEGWMDESTLIRDATREAMDRALAASATETVQNIAIARDPVNLRIEPGRTTDVIRRLRRGATLEVLARETTPRPDGEGTDIWLKVRPSRNEIGWVFEQLIEFQTPETLLPFNEGRVYTAVFSLKQVEDPEVGLVDWYLVGERRLETAPEYAFDGIRVFVWNLTEHRYETTLRLRNLPGVYPIELTGDAVQPAFRIELDSPDGRVNREFQMRGTVPRELR